LILGATPLTSVSDMAGASPAAILSVCTKADRCRTNFERKATLIQTSK
jgi:hypothetical protein